MPRDASRQTERTLAGAELAALAGLHQPLNACVGKQKGRPVGWPFMLYFNHSFGKKRCRSRRNARTGSRTGTPHPFGLTPAEVPDRGRGFGAVILSDTRQIAEQIRQVRPIIGCMGVQCSIPTSDNGPLLAQFLLSGQGWAPQSVRTS